MEIEGVWKLCPWHLKVHDEPPPPCGRGLCSRCASRGRSRCFCRSGELAEDLVHSLPGGLIRQDAGAHLSMCVEHSCVVTATESLSDRGKGELGQLAAEVHRHLASINNLAAAFGRG